MYAHLLRNDPSHVLPAVMAVMFAEYSQQPEHDPVEAMAALDELHLIVQVGWERRQLKQTTLTSREEWSTDWDQNSQTQL